MKEKIDLRAVAEAALREADGLVATTDECKTPIDKCRAKNGPAECRVHCVEYFDRLCDAVTFEKAQQGLKEKFGIEAVQHADASKLIAEPEFLDEIYQRTKPITEADFRQSVKALWIVLKDLKQRFPSLQIPPAIYVGGEPKSDLEYGWASLDTLYCKKGVISFNANQKMDSSHQIAFCHKDSRINFDVIRHEVGHLVSTLSVLTKWATTASATSKELGGNNALVQNLRDKVSEYSVFYFNHSPWRFLAESFAEIFSKRTSLDFSEKSYPTWALPFVNSVLNGEIA